MSDTEKLEEMKIHILSVGTTFDLRPNRHGDSYDLSKAEDRAKVRSILRTERPYLVIGCPACIECCQMLMDWNHHRMKPADVKKEIARRPAP